MALQVEAGSPLAQAIQNAVQPKLMDNAWVAEEGDTTLSEYVTMMIVNGKTPEQVISELGTDLLGVGEDDPGVVELARWLFQQIPVLNAQVNGGQVEGQDTTMNTGEGVAAQGQEGEAQPIPSVQDSQMDDATPADGIPSGPKAMRNGSTASAGRGGRAGRMLGQMNRQMDRTHDDPLRRIKGAAGGQAGRINSHAGRDPPRGPRQNALANGVQRMMGGGRPNQPASPMMPTGPLNPQQQMQFLQMMEMQSKMMAQMANMTGFNPGFPQQQPPPGQGKSLFDRVDKRQNGSFGKGGRQHIHNANNGDASASSGMDVDQAVNEDGTAKRNDPFDAMCRFNEKCTVTTCPFAHQSPAAAPGTTVDLTDRCSFGAACENRKCAGKHPSPAQRRQHLKDDVDCKFYPNCTNERCPFRHPDMPPCRNGADCTTPNCKFSHSKIMCRYTPCLNPACMYKHAEGQKRGKFEDKVWTAEGGEGDGEKKEGDSKADRFADLQKTEGQGEELIIPGNSEPEKTAEMDTQAETQIIT